MFSSSMLIGLFLAPSLKVLVSSNCPPCKQVQDCNSNYLGSYNLMEENSPFCPEIDGFTGCLYEKNGSPIKFCFKSGPMEQCTAYSDCTAISIDPDPKPADNNQKTTMGDPKSTVNQLDIDNDPDDEINLRPVIPGVTTRPCLESNFPNLADMSPEEVAGLCCDGSDCQEHAGCFLDELSNTYKTYCQCFLGYSLDNSSVALPKTGECKALKVQDCSFTASCYENLQYKICPYCHISAKDGMEETNIGDYESGDGSFDSGAGAMIFVGSSTECPEETTAMFWYCWYDVNQEVVDLNFAYVLVEDREPCEHWAYIYTPLACDYAKET